MKTLVVVAAIMTLLFSLTVSAEAGSKGSLGKLGTLVPVRDRSSKNGTPAVAKPDLLGMPTVGTPLKGIPAVAEPDLSGIPAVGTPPKGVPVFGKPAIRLPKIGIPVIGKRERAKTESSGSKLSGKPYIRALK